MTDTISRNAKDSKTGEDGRPDKSSQTRGANIAPAKRGHTSISDDVVEKIAGMAAREVTGVYGLGAGMSRAIGNVRDRVPGGGRAGTITRGVKVEVGERQAAVDLDVIVEYDVDIMEIAGDVRSTVVSEVEGMTGLEVVEVNIAVDDVHLPDDDSDSEDTSQNRVQ